MAIEKQKLKKGYTNNITLLGKINIKDKSFEIDTPTKTGSYNVSKFNTTINCGTSEVWVKLEALVPCGINPDGSCMIDNYTIRCNGTKETDNGYVQVDYNSAHYISWFDRNNMSLLEEKRITDEAFIKVGIERDEEGKIIIKKFLSSYDAILYLQENLSNNTEVIIKAHLELKIGSDLDKAYRNVIIDSIMLAVPTVSTIEFTAKDYYSKFALDVVITEDTFEKTPKVGDDGSIVFYPFFVSYVSKYNNENIKKNIAFPIQMKIDTQKLPKWKEMIDKLLVPSKNKASTVVIEGDYISTGNLVTLTLSDLPLDIQELIKVGVVSEEEALAKVVKGDKVYTDMVMKTIGLGTRKGVTVSTLNRDVYDIADILNIHNMVNMNGGTPTLAQPQKVETQEVTVADVELAQELFENADDFFTMEGN